MGYEAVTIRGVARTAKKDLWWTENDLRPNHSWNAVKLEGVWKLLDATWASGAADDDCQTIIREFSPFYFFPDPEQFKLSHLPADSSWQLSKKPLKPKDFISIPIFHDPYYELGIRAFSPENGVLEMKPDQTIEFSFQTDLPLEKIAVWCEENAQIKPEFGNFRKNGNVYTYAYKVKGKGDHFLNIAINGMKTSMVYYVKISDRLP
jgi:transglutaminase/protease-like cytokinesis protein 3